MSKKLGFIGAGAMAEAIIKGVIKSGVYSPEEIIASDINEGRLKYLEDKLGINVCGENNKIIESSDLIVFAVKPQYIQGAIEKLGSKPNSKQVIISIAAGVSTEFYEKLLPKQPVIRVMPNTPALVGAGMSALCKGSFADDTALKSAVEIFQAVGQTEIVEEYLINAVTGVSGSGPAYVYQFIEALADGGVQVGLPRKTAYTLAAQTVVGAGLMVLETGLHPAELKDMVTSPGGTTIKAVSVLEKAGMRGALMDAVAAATLMAEKLGSEK